MGAAPTARFDEFRAKYEGLTFEQLQEFYAWVVAEFPSQRQYDRGRWLRLFERAPSNARVLELGGWDGALAADILKAPVGETVLRWTNADIAPGLEDRQVCSDPRYEFVLLDRFLWDHEPLPHDVFVSSHAIEHLSATHVRALLEWLAEATPSVLLLEVPLDEEGQDWRGYYGSHVLPVGWRKLEAQVRSIGYRTSRERIPTNEGPGPRWWCAAWL